MRASQRRAVERLAILAAEADRITDSVNTLAGLVRGAVGTVATVPAPDPVKVRLSDRLGRAFDRFDVDSRTGSTWTAARRWCGGRTAARSAVGAA